MHFEAFLGYAGAFLIGLVLGLLGGGGALLTMPVLVYLFHVEASLATGYSLFLVAVTASSGALQNIRKKLVDHNAALFYGIPSVISVYLVRRFLIPNLPPVIFSIDKFTLDKDHFILIVLSVTMFVAAYKMISGDDKASAHGEKHKKHPVILTLYAVLIGSLMGFIGVGGGFLMVPALIYFANLPTRIAIGTSLVLVSANSLIGFLGDMGTHPGYNWPFLLLFSSFSVAGVLAGHYLTNFLEPEKLKKYFGWFILLIAIYIIARSAR